VWDKLDDARRELQACVVLFRFAIHPLLNIFFALLCRYVPIANTARKRDKDHTSDVSLKDVSVHLFATQSFRQRCLLIYSWLWQDNPLNHLLFWALCNDRPNFVELLCGNRHIDLSGFIHSNPNFSDPLSPVFSNVLSVCNQCAPCFDCYLTISNPLRRPRRL
jgi:hypothetical protein